MKKNVDLTENKIFSNWNKRTVILGPFNSIPKFPWHQAENINTRDNQLVLTGYVKDIKYKKEISSYINRDKCERCGKPFTSCPWNFYYGLCKQCNTDVEGYVQKLWRIDKSSMQYSINQSSDRVIIELNYMR